MHEDAMGWGQQSGTPLAKDPKPPKLLTGWTGLTGSVRPVGTTGTAHLALGETVAAVFPSRDD